MSIEEPAELRIKSWYGRGGALVTDAEVPGVTDGGMLSPDSQSYYGGKFFIAESMSESAAKEISKALRLNYQGVAHGK